MSLAAAARDLRERAQTLPPWTVDVALAVLVAAAIMTSGATTVNDWRFYAQGADTLTSSSSLDLYATTPWIQIGPLALFVAAVIDLLPGSALMTSVLVISLLFIPVMALLRLAFTTLGRDPRITLDRGWVRALLALGWFPVAAISQLGDVLALIGLLAAAVLLMRGSPWWAGTVFALGVAAKPWILASLVVLAFAPRASRWRAAVAAGLVGLACWLPFVMSDSRTLEAGRIQYYVPPDAWQRWFGVGDLAPDGWRAWQLAVIWLAMLPWFIRAVRRGDWNHWVPLVLGATTLLRLATELGTWTYYVSVSLPLVLLAERACAPDRRPYATWLTLFAAVNFEPVIGGTAAAALRLSAFAAALALLVVRHRDLLRSADSGPNKDESGPTSVMRKDRSST